MKRFILCFAMLVIACLCLTSCGNKDERVYKCSEWKLVVASVSDGQITENTLDILKEYKSYVLVLKDNGMFTLEYQYGEKNYSYAGTYKEEDNQIFLTYTDAYAEENGCYPTYKVSSDGKTLTRNQFNENIGTGLTVKQTFNLK